MPNIRLHSGRFLEQHAEAKVAPERTPEVAGWSSSKRTAAGRAFAFESDSKKEADSGK